MNELIFVRIFPLGRRYAPQYAVLQPFACKLYAYQFIKVFGGVGAFFKKPPTYSPINPNLIANKTTETFSGLRRFIQIYS